MSTLSLLFAYISCFNFYIQMRKRTQNIAKRR